MEDPLPRDWVSQVLEDLEEININLELDKIKHIQKDKLKSLIQNTIKIKAF